MTLDEQIFFVNCVGMFAGYTLGKSDGQNDSVAMALVGLISAILVYVWIF